MNSNKLPALVLLVVSVTGLISGGKPCLDCAPTPPSRPVPGPILPPPGPPPSPSPWRPTLGTGLVPFVGQIVLGGNMSPDGRVEIQVDVPLSERIENIGSRRDGAGMCVMSSIEVMFRWGNLEPYRGLRDWAAQFPGGAYPSKVTQQIQQYVTERHITAPPWFQYEGADPALIVAALRTGRPVAVTYNGRDGVRYTGRIAHMVTLVHYDDQWVCILDNNGIGANELLWMTPADFLERWRDSGRGWAVFSTAPPPPPCPRG